MFPTDCWADCGLLFCYRAVLPAMQLAKGGGGKHRRGAVGSGGLGLETSFHRDLLLTHYK